MGLRALLGSSFLSVVVGWFLGHIVLESGAALLPPLLVGLGVLLDLGQPVAQDLVGGDLVGGLEDDLTPAGNKGVGLCGIELGMAREQREDSQTHLHDDVTQLLLHLFLGAQEALPQVVADATALEQGAAGLFGGADLDDAVDVLNSAAQQGGADDAVGNLGGLVGAFFRFHVKKREVDVALEVRAEPWGQVGALDWRGGVMSAGLLS